MSAKRNRNKRKINLLEMPDSERRIVMEKLRQTLQRNVAETKLLNCLLQCETLTINGQIVFSGETALDGLLMQKTDM